VYRRDVNSSSLGVGNYRTSTLAPRCASACPSRNTTRCLRSGAGVRPFVPRRHQPAALSGLPKRIRQQVRNADWQRRVGSRHAGQRIWPTRGNLRRANLEVATPPGDLEYWKLTYTHQYFYPVSKKYHPCARGGARRRRRLRKQALAVLQELLLGGIGSVRGFRTASLGPRDLDGAFLGGTRKLNGTNGAPVPDARQRARPLDEARSLRRRRQVYGSTDKVELSQLRAAYGFSFAWNSPIGPMKSV